MSDNNQRIAELEREVAELKKVVEQNHKILDGLQQMLLETVFHELPPEKHQEMIENLYPMAATFHPDDADKFESKGFGHAWHYPYFRFWKYLTTFRPRK